MKNLLIVLGYLSGLVACSGAGLLFSSFPAFLLFAGIWSAVFCTILGVFG